MADHDHYPDCHRHHMSCALLRIWDLEKEVQTLKTQLQVERTGHLTEQNIEAPFTTHATHIPCGNPWFTHHGEEPPSATP